MIAFFIFVCVFFYAEFSKPPSGSPRGRGKQNGTAYLGNAGQEKKWGASTLQLNPRRHVCGEVSDELGRCSTLEVFKIQSSH